MKVIRKVISEVVDVNPRTPPEIFSDLKRVVDFVPMVQLSEKGHVTPNGSRPVGEVLKGYTYFENGDVLVAKITPCMENGKAAFVHNLPHQIGFGSTEFHVLRPGDSIEGRYLFYMIWNSEFRNEAERHMTGSAGQKRVPKSFFDRFEIPLPPLSEQKRIADILDKADAIRRKRQEAVNVFTPLIMACFRDCFGSSPEAAWKSTSFGDLVESTQLGLVRSSKEMSDEHPFPYLRMDALIGDGDLTLRSIKRVQATQEESEQYRLRSRDFLFNTRNSRELVGKTAVWHDEYESPVLFNNNIMRVRFRKEVDPVYMNYLFYVPQMRHLLEQRKSGTTSVFAIYYKNLKDLPIPVPPLELQGRFADFVNATLQWRVTSCGASTESQHLFDSLVQRAFKGVL